MRDRGSISDSTKKQTISKYFHRTSAGGAAPLQTSAMAQGSGRDTAFAAVSCAAAACLALGGAPDRMAIQITLPADADLSLLAGLAAGAAQARSQYSLPEADCRTLVLDGSFLPAVTAFASSAASAAKDSARQVPAAGREIIMTGYAGWRGSALLEQIYRERLEKHFSPSFLKPVREADPTTFSPLEAVQAGLAAGADAFYICGEGGVFAGLWNLAQMAGCGIRAELDKIPLRQETVEICDLTGVSPYQLMSHGCVLMTAQDPAKVQIQLAGAGIPACVIGYLTGSNDRVVINGEETRFLEPFRKDSFYDRDEQF